MSRSGIVRLEEQQLRDDDVRDVIVDRRAEEDDAVHEEPREDVVGALAAARALDDVRRVDRRHWFFVFPFRHWSSTSFRSSSHLNTLSSVMLRSISFSRPLFCELTRTPGRDSAPRFSACSAMRSSMSFSVAVRPSFSAIVSITQVAPDLALRHRPELAARTARAAPSGT